MGPWASLPARGLRAPLRATAPLAAELSVATGARELSSCRQGRTRCSCHVLALARGAGHLPLVPLTPRGTGGLPGPLPSLPRRGS